MAFDDFELSRWLGKPLHLFQFIRQGTIERFANAPRDQVIGGFTYKAAVMSRSEIRQTVERAKDRLKITMAYLLNPTPPAEGFPSTQDLGGWWRPYIPSDPIKVICLATHYGDTDPPKVEWMGWAVQPEYTDLELVLTCDPNHPAGEARNQGAKWQKGCWKSVYSTGIRGCNLDPEPLTIVATLSNIVGLTLTAAEFATSAFPLAGGTLYWTRTDGIEEERPIMAHSGTSVQILWDGDELAIGTDVTALPGCPQNWNACDARGNTINYGGAIYKPIKDPAGGASMSW